MTTDDTLKLIALLRRIAEALEKIAKLGINVRPEK